jgi:hypothetical protein
MVSQPPPERRSDGKVRCSCNPKGDDHTRTQIKFCGRCGGTGWLSKNEESS